MPSVTGEGIHRVIFVCVLDCCHTVEFYITPSVGDYLLCCRCNDGSHVLSITRKQVSPVRAIEFGEDVTDTLYVAESRTA